jgi:hypothetical protein
LYYETIQAAVDEADANDHLTVAAGQHKITSTITINRPITLSGASDGRTLLEVDKDSGKSGIAVMPGGDGTVIEGLEIIKTDKDVLSGSQELIYIQADNVKILDNELHGQYEMGDPQVARAMIVAAGVTNLEVSRNVIYGLRQPAYFSGKSGTITGNYVYGTRGWVIEQGNWEFQDNTWGSGDASNYVDIAILANEGGQNYQSILALSEANNNAVVEDQRTSPPVLSHVHVDVNAETGGDGTPTRPYRDISEGVARVVQGGTVYVAEGTYDVTQISIQKGLTLKGAGTGKSIINGNPDEVLSGAGMIRIVGANSQVILDGFTLQNAGGTGSGTICSILTKSPLLVQNCHFIGRDDGDLFDMGIWAYSTAKTAHVTVQDCTFEKMWQGILLEQPRGGATVVRNVFRELRPGSGATYAEYEPEGVFAFTYGGAANDVNARLTVSENEFRDFSGVPIAVGGGYYNQSTSKFTWVEVEGNVIDAIGEASTRSHAGIQLRNYGVDMTAAQAGGVHGAVISGNVITGTGSSNTYGIWLGGIHTDITITENTISGVHQGIAIESHPGGEGFATDVRIAGNSIVGNTIGVSNESDVTLDATLNYWGDAAGPTRSGVSAGDPIQGKVSFDPWYEDSQMTMLVSTGPAVVRNQTLYDSIQAAIDDATSGEEILLGKGTYTEALNITKAVTIKGSGIGETVIKPSALLQTGVGHKYDSNMAVSVFVNGAGHTNGHKVSIQDLTIDGNGDVLNGHAVVFWNDSVGSLERVEVTNPRPFGGVQTGQAVAVDAGSGKSTVLNVKDCSIHTFNKNGIDAVNGNGTTVGGGSITVNVTGGSITGRGATDTNGQNGVLFWERAGGSVGGTIDGTLISNFEYTPDADEACGILLYGLVTGDVSIRNVDFSGTEYYIYLGEGTNGSISVDTCTFDGVSPATASSEQLSAIEDKIEHGLDDASLGVVMLKANTLVVTPNTRGVQAALNMAPQRSTVLVLPGTYHESLNLTKPVTLRSNDGPGVTVLDGDSETENYYMVSIAADDVTLDGFTITNPKYNGTTDASGIVIGTGSRNRNIRITNCVIHDIGTPDRAKVSFGTFGVNCGPVEGLEIDNCTIYNIFNGAEAAGAIGIFTWGNNNVDTTKDVSIRDNTISHVDNPGASVYGISVGFYGDDITVANNTISGIKTGIRVSDSMVGSASVVGNTIENATVRGLRLDGRLAQNISGNTISDCETGVWASETAAGITMRENQILGSKGFAVEAEGTIAPLDAELNYWGMVEPVGDLFKGTVDFEPWYLDEDMDIQSDKLKLTVSVSGEGGVKKEPPGPEYSYGDVVKLTPAPGWRFSSWSSNVAASEGYLEVTMDWNKTVALTLSRVGETSGGGGGPSGPTGPVLPPVIAPSVTAPIDTTTGGTVELEDGSAAVEMPPNATEEEVTVTLAPVTEVTQPTTGMVMIAGKVYEITAETSDGELVTQFSRPLTLTFRVTEEELEETEAELEDLRVFYWDEKAGAWIALPTTVDPETGTVTALTDHFTVFALMAKPDMPALNDIPGHWAEKYILRLVSLGVVGGYEDGSYRPEAGITRQEFAKMVVLAAGLEADAEPELTFADAGEIAGWARGYVSAAVKAGIITGVGDNRFAPADPVTRAQAATMIIRALGIEASGTPEAFADGDAIPEWALSSIQAAVEKAIIDGFEDNTFRPDLNATRAQAAKMLSRLTEVRFED